MKNLYPRFQENYTQEELIENFWLTNDEIIFVETFRSEVNRQAVAVLLKSLKYLSFFPEGFDKVPESVKTFIARELNALWDVTNQYDWVSSIKDRHFSLIREFSGWRSATSNDKENLARWLEENAAGESGSEEELFETAIRRLKHLRIELPSRKELERLTSTVWNNMFETIYRTRQRYFLKNKYVRHYQRILPVMPENLDFRSGNRRQPVIAALEIIKKYIGTNFQYFPEDVPTDIVTPSWKTTVFEESGDELKVNRKGYELCVLHKLEKALKCKGVWIEGAKIFRNPQEDLPGDWDTKRLHYYEMLSQKPQAAEFVAGLKEQMHEALHNFDLNIPRNPSVKYGRQGVFATNSREHQEISNLALRLLQNCLMLINTILVEKTIEKENMISRLSVEDLRALSPLFYEHINPYGVFEINVNRPSFLQKEAI